MEAFEFYLRDLVISFPTQVFWPGDAEKCAKEKMEIKDVKGSVGKQVQLNCKKAGFTEEITPLPFSLEQCYSKCSMHMNHWGDQILIL